MKPRSVVFENVAGLAQGSGSWRLMQADRQLRKLGYDVAWKVVQAADYGVPQFRRRLLVIASNLGVAIEIPSRTHADPKSDDVRKGIVTPWLTVRDAIGNMPALRSGECYPKDELHSARTHSKIALERLSRIPEDGGSRSSLPPRLVLACHINHSGHHDVYGRMHWDRPAPTITSGCTNITRGRFAHPVQNRAISEREALALQGFPAEATVTGNHSQRTLQIGNAVPPALSAAAARQVRALMAAAAKLDAQQSA
jgi:DNA (cytosine-5)-methyltransferase 1